MTIFYRTAAAVLLTCAVFAQNAPALKRLPVKARIVLTTEFCSSKQRQSLSVFDVIKIGKQACEQLYNALLPVFAELNRVDAPPVAAMVSEEFTLIPRFLDISTTQPALPGMKQELILLMEWTVTNPSGKLVWLETVRGSNRSTPDLLTPIKWRREFIKAAIDDLASASALKLSQAREISQP